MGKRETVLVVISGLHSYSTSNITWTSEPKCHASAGSNKITHRDDMVVHFLEDTSGSEPRLQEATWRILLTEVAQALRLLDLLGGRDCIPVAPWALQ
jgi:hypothetical protein